LKAKAKTIQIDALSKREIDKLKYYLKHFAIILSVILFASYISYVHRRLDKEIMALQNQKSNLVAENFELKQEIANLSNPKRISDIARNKMKMQPVDYKNVHFIEK